MTEQQKADVGGVQRRWMRWGSIGDVVQIFVCRQENSQGGTVNVALGTGNWFARYGQVRHWLLKEEEGARMEARRVDQ